MNSGSYEQINVMWTSSLRWGERHHQMIGSLLQLSCLLPQEGALIYVFGPSKSLKPLELSSVLYLRMHNKQPQFVCPTTTCTTIGKKVIITFLHK